MIDTSPLNYYFAINGIEGYVRLRWQGKGRIDPSVMVASLFYTGYIPIAPGTFGTLLSFLFILFFKPDRLFLALFVVFLFIVGIYVSQVAERRLNEKDSRHIVIDEFVGYLVGIYGIEPDKDGEVTLGGLAIAFLLFRFFDVLKPFPIKRFQRLSGGYGIMMDDLVAGIYTNISLRILKGVLNCYLSTNCYFATYR